MIVINLLGAQLNHPEQYCSGSKGNPSVSSFQTQPSNTPSCHQSLSSHRTSKDSKSSEEKGKKLADNYFQEMRKIDLFYFAIKNIRLILTNIPPEFRQELICKPMIVVSNAKSTISFRAKVFGRVKDENQLEISLDINSSPTISIDQNEIPEHFKNDISIDFGRFIRNIDSNGFKYSDLLKKKWEDDNDEVMESLTPTQKRKRESLKLAVYYWINHVFSFDE